MVKIKRVYDSESPADGKRILVDRLWPRRIRKEEIKIDEWLKDIAPSDELRRWFAHDPAKWEEFKRRYFQELNDKKKLIEELKNQAAGRTITFLFSAKDTEHNNAIALRELIEK
jgi:uncharacterized protein YeaO (DUF488 family)